jgi:hypothetical protein
MSGGGSNNTSAPIIGNLNIQTSTYGLPIPLVWGQQRIAANLLWYGYFVAISHVAKTGGKGGGGSYSNTTYSYQAAGLMGLCEGPISGVKSVWAAKNDTTLANLGLTLNVGNPSPTASDKWTFFREKATIKGAGNNLGQGLAYAGVATVQGSQYVLSDSAQMPNHTFEVTGRYSVGFTGTISNVISLHNDGSTVKCLVLDNYPAGLQVNDIVQFKTNTPLVALPTPFLMGVDYYYVGVGSVTYGGVTKSYIILTAKPYISTADQTANPFLSPTTTTFPVGTGSIAIQRVNVDARPSDVITDFLINPSFGVSPTFPLGNLTSFAAYCDANDLYIAPALISQVAGHNVITDIASICNSAPVWSDGKLKLIPYGDSVINGGRSGITYDPATYGYTTPKYDLTDDDFIADSSTDPITVHRLPTADAFNQVTVAYKNRLNQYNANTVSASDLSNINLFGVRAQQQVQMDYVVDGQIARNVVQMMLQRVLNVRNQYKFTLGWKYALLEVMDLVTLTDSELDMNLYPVRIIEIEEDEDEQLKITAEDFPSNNATISAYPHQPQGGYTSAANGDPGLSKTPVIFRAPTRLTTSGYELWLASAGGSNWGSADVYASIDDISYKKVASLNGASRYGYTTNSLTWTSANDAGPIIIDTSSSGATFNGGSVDDANSNITLSILVDGANTELVSYSYSVLTATNQYTLDTYINHNIYDTAKANHPIGTPFVRLDNALAKFSFDPSWEGKTIYIKLLPFNHYGGGSYDLSMVSSTRYTIPVGLGRPSVVTGFSAGQNGSVTVFQWDQSTDPATYISGYEFRYNTLGSMDWAHGIAITRSTKGTQITTAKVPPGYWTLMCCAVDIAGRYSATPATFIINITNLNTIVYSEEESPAWVGTLNHLVRHPNGTLFPDSSNLAIAGSAMNFVNSVLGDVPEQCCEDPTGAFVYVANYGYLVSDGLPTYPGSIVLLNKASDGTLSYNTSYPCGSGTYGITMSADGNNVYATANDGAEIWVFTKSSDGTLTFIEKHSTYYGEPSENLLTYSDSFPVDRLMTQVSISPDLVYAPDSQTLGDTLYDTAVASVHTLSRPVPITGQYTYSCHFQAGSLGYVAMGFSTSSADLAWFNLASGIVGTVGSNLTNAMITGAGSAGWFRCSVSSVGSVNPTIGAATIMLVNGDTVTSYTGTGTGSVTVWGEQLESGSVLSAYTRTLNEPHNYGVAPISSSNLIPYSQDFGTAYWTRYSGSTVTSGNSAPDGTDTAFRLVNTSTVSMVFHNSLTAAATLPMTASVYVRRVTTTSITLSLTRTGASASVVLNPLNGTVTTSHTGTMSIVTADAIPVGGDWFRLTLTAVDSNLFITLFNFQLYGGLIGQTVDIWGAQFEIAAFLSPYYSTSGTAASARTLGGNPRDLVVTPDGTMVYISCADDAIRCFERNTASGVLNAIDNVPVHCAYGSAPHGIVVDTSGAFIYSVNYGNDTIQGYATGGALVPIGSPVATSLSGGEYPHYATVVGNRLYVAATNADTIAGFNLSAGIPTRFGIYPATLTQGITSTPDGTKIFATGFNADNGQVIFEYFIMSGGALQLVGETPSIGAQACIATHDGTGLLVTNGSETLSYKLDDGWSTFNQFVPEPYDVCEYIHPVVDIGFDSNDRAWSEITGYIPPTSYGAVAPVLSVSYCNTATYPTFSSWFPWSVGVVPARYVQMKVSINTMDGIPAINSFKPTIDATTGLQQSGAATIMATGGTAITYPSRYHNNPIVTITPTVVGLYGVVTATSPTTFTARLYTAGGTETTGTFNWTSTGA